MIDYKEICNKALDRINKSIIDNWHLYYIDQRKITLHCNNRLWIIWEFDTYKDLFYHLRGICIFLNLIYNDNIEIDIKHFI